MLEAQNIGFSYGTGTLFSDVGLEVSPSRLFRIHGRNGAGKSTLLKILAGILKPSTGSLRFQGPESKHLISYLPPGNNGLMLPLTATDNLLFWQSMTTRTPNRDQALAILASWGIPAKIATTIPVSAYSTGMRRKVGLARVMSSNTRIWLLDEPCASLDQSSIQILTSSLTAHLNSGGAAVVISHNDGLFEPFANVATVML